MQTEYTIWLMPHGHEYDIIKDIINSLAQKYNSVSFEPHLTLLGDILLPKEEVISKTHNLAKVIKPFTITLGEVAYLNEFYRSVFIKAEPSSHLLSANQTARMLFNRQNDSEFMPHVSLLYGIYKEEVKKEILKEIGTTIILSFEVNKLIVKEGTIGEQIDFVRKWKIVADISIT